MKRNKHYLFPIFYILLVALVVSPASLTAQGQNALAFDGVNDNVNVSAASALITSASGLTLSCWVYPTNANSQFPDFDGFAGFRNDATVDFYLCQLYSNTVEARFRVSSTAYTLSYTGLQLNTWQHYTLVYTGTQLKLYHNAIAVDSVNAGGVISNSAVTFYIGKLAYYTNNYNFQGMIDEVGLWNKALTAGEVKCIYEDGIHMPDPNLKLWFAMNEGTANGNNVGTTVLADSSNNMAGVLSGFAMTGTTSNFVDGVISYHTISDTICAGQSYIFGSQTLTTAGTYSAVLTSAGGCDSTVVLNLAVSSVDVTITQSGDTLKSNEVGASYRWLKCDNNFSPLPGATSAVFVPTTGGSFGVEVTKNGCVDTSNCILIVVTGLNDPQPASQWTMFPNPAGSVLFIDPVGLESGLITLLDITGKEVLQSAFNGNGKLKIDVSGLHKGIWVIRLESKRKTDFRKLIIQ